jgi:prepilin-type N-terminal cleavage/methylation domain-containing protein
MTRRHSKYKSGYTLTEVLVASVLLLVVSVPMLKALTTGYVYANTVRYKTQSTAYAQSRLARARAIAAAQYHISLAESNTDVGQGYLCSVTDTGYSIEIRTVAVSVGYDRDEDGLLDADEIDITLTSKIAYR